MFKKKATQEKVKMVNRTPLHYEEDVIRSCIQVLKDALETGQMTHKMANKGETSILVAFSSGYAYREDNGYVHSMNNYYGYPILDQMEIKSKEAIEKEIKEAKQKELAKLRECQAKDVGEIERLARELGEL